MSASDLDRLKVDIDEIFPDLVATRRDLHEHPELAFEEVRTSGSIAQRLQKLGLEVQTGIAKTGVVGLLRGGAADANAKTLAIRADIDALPIQELNEIEYRSRVEGKMHACGHDGHTSVALAVADILHKRRAELKGDIKFLFQPAEEQISGAKLMVEQNTMQGVDGVIGLHLWSVMPVGTVAVRPGPVFAGGSAFILTVKGKGGHAALPHEAVDPIVIAAYITTALQTLVSRETSPFSPAVITITRIEAGTAFNIIPEEVVMKGAMRFFIPEHGEYLLRRAEEVANGIATAMGGSCTMELPLGVPPCANDPAMTQLVHRAAAVAVGEEHILTGTEAMTTASDDMAYFLQSAPGCYFLVGAQNEQVGAAYPHHHPRFNIDEDALPIAVEVLSRAALEFLE
jgi:amidohydrolase